MKFVYFFFLFTFHKKDPSISSRMRVRGLDALFGRRFNARHLTRIYCCYHNGNHFAKYLMILQLLGLQTFMITKSQVSHFWQQNRADGYISVYFMPNQKTFNKYLTGITFSRDTCKLHKNTPAKCAYISCQQKI